MNFQIVATIVLVCFICSHLFLIVDISNLKAYIREHEDCIQILKANARLNDEDIKKQLKELASINSRLSVIEHDVSHLKEKFQENPIEFCSYDAYKAEYERTKKEV